VGSALECPRTLTIAAAMAMAMAIAAAAMGVGRKEEAKSSRNVGVLSVM